MEGHLETVWLMFSSDGKYVKTSVYPIKEEDKMHHVHTLHYHNCNKDHKLGPGCKYWDWTVIKVEK